MNNSSGIIEIDIHRMTKKQAWYHISELVRKASPSVYRIRVIHGYNGGTELQRMVRTDFKRNKKVKRIEIGLNPGQTDLILRELY